MASRVFLSSTFTDLSEYRKTVQTAIRQLGAVDVSMEHFGARDERPAEECVRLVHQESDLFVGIYAHRYGYVPDGADVSISEMEYKAASDAALPRFIYVVDENQPWLPSHVDDGTKRARLIEEGPKGQRNRAGRPAACLRQKRHIDLFLTFTERLR